MHPNVFNNLTLMETTLPISPLVKNHLTVIITSCDPNLHL